MAANVSVNFALLMDRHLDSRMIRAVVKGIPRYVDETCCVQLSHALAGAGAPVEDYAFHNPDQNRTVRAFASGGRNYVFEVSDLKWYLNGRYGEAENFRGSRSSIVEALDGRTGILAMGHRHVDLWTGADIHRPRLYRMDYLWTNASIKQRGVFFWEVTSEWGF